MPPSQRRLVVDRMLALGALALAIIVGYGVFGLDGLAPSESVMQLPQAAAIPSIGIPTQLVDPRPAAEPSGVTPEPSGEPGGAPLAPDTTGSEPKPVRGRVLDNRQRPLAGASIVFDGQESRAGPDGLFALEHVSPGTTLLVKMPGYAKQTVSTTTEPIEVSLAPTAIKAAYLTYFGVGDPGIRGRVLDLVDRTELNALVIDVKGDRGFVLYPSDVPLARAAGTEGPATLRDFDALMADLKARRIYTIARIVTFKDNVLATHRPDLAIIDARTGKPWLDREKLAWVDPFREETWDYNIALAKEAARHGFDEVQFDYVRFPTDGRLSATRYAKPNTRDTRLPAIVGFLGRARREIGPTGAFVAADIFGYTAFNESDTDIGQRIEELAPHLDYLCPMVYPSGYHLGIPGYRNPVRHPYEVVRESVRLVVHRASHTPTRVRPWLQDFRDYAFGRRLFGVREIQAQIRGATDVGAAGWMLWNPRNVYTGEALQPEPSIVQRDEAKGP